MVSEENKFEETLSGNDTPVDSSHDYTLQGHTWGGNLWSRRQALGLFGGTIAGVTLSLGLRSPTARAQDVTNPVVEENQQPGTNKWRLKEWSGYSWSDDVSRQVQGYASATSVNKGQQINFHVTVNPVQQYNVEVYRMGWYDGLGGRLLESIGPLTGATQPAPTLDNTTGLVDCNWSVSYTLDIPDSWTSGIYLAVLTNEQKYQSYVIFVVRDDARVADLLYQQPVTTYQAYNGYPNDSETGKSLYAYNSYGPTTTATGTAPAVKVSFDRPYSDGHGAGQFAYSWQWERHFIWWLEKNGYDVTYSTNLDTHADGARLQDYKGFLSIGHDEYWSNEMYDAVKTARDSGTSLAFFGSNAVYWQIRFESSTRGDPNRAMICYRDATKDPVQGPTTTVRWRDPPLNRPEQGLIGVQSTSQLLNDEPVAYVVKNSSHWVYDGTGFADGDRVPGIVGYETDRQSPDYPTPQGTDYTILSHSPVTNTEGLSDYQNSSIYQAPSEAWVFGAGTNHWSYGLDKDGVVDPRIQKTTANILDRFINPTTSGDRGMELLIIVLATILLFFFGAKRVPGLGRSLGKGIREFRQGSAEAGNERRVK